jgi:hypothetical protein
MYNTSADRPYRQSNRIKPDSTSATKFSYLEHITITTGLTVRREIEMGAEVRITNFLGGASATARQPHIRRAKVSHELQSA